MNKDSFWLSNINFKINFLYIWDTKKKLRLKYADFEEWKHKMQDDYLLRMHILKYRSVFYTREFLEG